MLISEKNKYAELGELVAVTMGANTYWDDDKKVAWFNDFAQKADELFPNSAPSENADVEAWQAKADKLDISYDE